LGAAYSNTVLVGLPIVSTGLGERALLPMFMLISVHAATMFSLVTIFSERGNGAGRTRFQIVWHSMKNLSRNSIVLGLMLGLLVNLLNIPRPVLLDDFINLLGQAALPCAIFVLGASLNAYKITGHLKEAWAIIGFKMVLQPALVAVLAFGVFDLEPLWGAVAVMTAALPVGINAFIFAEQYKSGVAFISSAILISTVLAVITESILLGVFLPML
jgi:predicted permease